MLLKNTLPVLSAVLLSFAAAPAAPSAPSHNQLVSRGHGSYLAFNQQVVLDFTYVVRGEENGTVEGFAIWRGPNSVTIWQVSSFTFVGEALVFAGPIIKVIGTPPPGHAVGLTAFTAVKDNGSADETASLSVVPPQFGNPTVQQIIALIGPPPAYLPLLSGSIWIR